MVLKSITSCQTVWSFNSQFFQHVVKPGAGTQHGTVEHGMTEHQIFA